MENITELVPASEEPKKLSIAKLPTKTQSQIDWEKEHPHAREYHDEWVKSHKAQIDRQKEREKDPKRKDKSKFGEPRPFDPNFEGPIADRSCTDIPCLILLIICILLWIAVGAWAFWYGVPDKILNPTDSSGQICGRGAAKDRPNLFYFDLTQCLLPTSLVTGCLTSSVCVDKCPESGFTYLELMKIGPGQVNTSKLYCIESVDKTKLTTFAKVSAQVAAQRCASYYFPSGAIGRRCFPGLKQDSNGSVVPFFQDQMTNQTVSEDGKVVTPGKVQEASLWLQAFVKVELFFHNAANDLKASWTFLLGSLFASIGFAFVWIILIRWIAGPMVWTAIIGTFVALCVGIYVTVNKYIELKAEALADGPALITMDFSSYLAKPDTWLVFAILLGCITLVFKLTICYLKPRISIAIALLAEGSRCVGSIFSALFFPLFPFTLQCIVVGIGVVVGLYLQSAGDTTGTISAANFTMSNLPGLPKINSTCNPVDSVEKLNASGLNCIFKAYESTSMLLGFQAYNFFMLFWGMFFVEALGEITLAGAFASYYWTWDKEHALPVHPIYFSLKRACRFHLGTIAFGSLIITIVRMMRYLITYLHRKLRGIDHPVARVLLKACNCFLWCMERFLKYINENAYIVTAVYGKNFLTAAKEVFFLLMRNIVRVVVLDSVLDFIMLMGKLSIAATLGGLTYAFFERKIPGTEHLVPLVHYSWVPTVVVCLGAYIVASLFFDVYEMAIDTLFLCFLEDLEQNDGTPEKPFFMPRKLMELLGKKNAVPAPIPDADSEAALI